MMSSTTDNASVSPVTAIHYRYQQAGDVNVFYREAGIRHRLYYCCFMASRVHHLCFVT